MFVLRPGTGLGLAGAMLDNQGGPPACLPGGWGLATPTRWGYTLGAVGKMRDEKDANASVLGSLPSRRLPYEKPAVSWEQPLEAQPSLMSGCQKLPGQSLDCDTASYS